MRWYMRWPIYYLIVFVCVAISIAVDAPRRALAAAIGVLLLSYAFWMIHGAGRATQEPVSDSSTGHPDRPKY